MRRLVAFSAIAVLCAMALPAGAQGHLPIINGGGVTTNSDSGGFTYGGFTARATAPGEDAGEYEARGQVQGRSTTSDGTTVARVHGDVVCIANLGPAGEEGGGDPEGDVWEIRFRVKHSDPDIPSPAHASAFVQDNGRDDYADENFDPAEFTNPDCGDVTEYELEEVVHGNITVHD